MCSNRVRCFVGKRSRSKNVTLSSQVLWYAPTNVVSSGIVKPRSASISRTRESLAICAKARALGPPRPPLQAPQLYADSCGLFRLDEPCPHMIDDRREVLGQADVAQQPFDDVGHFIQRIADVSVVGSRFWFAPLQRSCVTAGGRTSPPKMRRIWAVVRGNRIRMTIGIDASVPPSAVRHSAEECAASLMDLVRSRSRVRGVCRLAACAP